jgi:Tol biopolymer transport system component
MRLTLLAVAAVCVIAATAAADVVQSRSGLVAYGHRGADDRPRIWLMLPDAYVRGRQLKLGRNGAVSPRWSGDGRRLLYATPSAIYIAELATTAPGGHVVRTRRVAPLYSEWGLDWSPDGTTIVYPQDVGTRHCTDLYTMRTDGSRARRLTSSVGCEQHPAWSPDGFEIAFEREDERRTEIVVTGVREGRQRVLGHGTFPAWSPDGRSLAFLAQETIQIVDSSTGALLGSLTPDLEYDRLQDGLAWSPDGTRLVHGFNDLQETKPVTHLAVIDVDGTDSFQVTPKDTFPDMEPDWQPICTVYGTDGDDVLVGTPEDDLICGLRGDDVIRGGPGDDTILAGDGNDSIHGGEGSDRLFGAAGDDRLYALDAQPDIVNGGPGRDRMWGDQDDTVTEVEERRG